MLSKTNRRRGRKNTTAHHIRLDLWLDRLLVHVRILLSLQILLQVLLLLELLVLHVLLLLSLLFRKLAIEEVGLRLHGLIGHRLLLHGRLLLLHRLLWHSRLVVLH